ncbi:hypothetical protein DPEC_G00025810 [Dallia pectoralis]|uniref:Uncharacterized protein n=1 Tax=Dallia pectoralis TaxID=75939 RepID=A0ACC2HHS2_DALPE|nr:hypothetical protein DPEC_G00025810 [Dallia pectoralis]
MEAVVLQGMLYCQRNMLGKKTWRKTLAMLYPPSVFGIGRLELYDLDCVSTNTYLCSQWSRSPSVRKVVRLCDCLTVTTPSDTSPLPLLSLYNDPSPDFKVFCVNTTKIIYTLASEDHQDWFTALSQLAFQAEPIGWMDHREKKKADWAGMNIEEKYTFPTWRTAQYVVNIHTNEASRRCQLTGSYLLSPGRDVVLLQDLQNHKIVYCWPYHLLRRFGQVKGGLCIEAGRRCTSGEGLFTFMSERAPEIYKTIIDAIALLGQMDNGDNKTPIQHPLLAPSSSLSSPQFPPKTVASNSPSASFSMSGPPHSSSPPPPHPSSSSPRLHNKPKGPAHSLADCSDRFASPPLPMRNNVLPSPLMTAPVIDSDLCQKLTPMSDGYLYATVNDQILPVLRRTPAPLRVQHSLPLHGNKEEEDTEDRCHSLDAINLDKLGLGLGVGLGMGLEDSTYYNIHMGSIRRVEEKGVTVRTSSDCVYTEVNMPPSTQLPSLPPVQTLSLGQPRRGEETGLLGSGGSVPTSGVPVSFKQKLSDMLCKDLAKFQPPRLPPGAAVTERQPLH